MLQAFHQQLAAQDPFFASEGDDKSFAILSMTQLLSHDENGRVRLPDEFIAHAGLKDKVSFVGMGRKFQVWETERFAQIQAERLARARAVRDGQRSHGSGE